MSCGPPGSKIEKKYSRCAEQYSRIRKDLKTAFEVRKLSRRGSMERGEADLGRVLPMNFPPTHTICFTLSDLDVLVFLEAFFAASAITA